MVLRAVNRELIGGVYIHIFAFCPTNSSGLTRIYEYTPPPPQINALVTSLVILAYWTFYTSFIDTMIVNYKLSLRIANYNQKPYLSTGKPAICHVLVVTASPSVPSRENCSETGMCFSLHNFHHSCTLSCDMEEGKIYHKWQVHQIIYLLQFSL